MGPRRCRTDSITLLLDEVLGRFPATLAIFGLAAAESGKQLFYLTYNTISCLSQDLTRCAHVRDNAPAEVGMGRSACHRPPMQNNKSANQRISRINPICRLLIG